MSKKLKKRARTGLDRSCFARSNSNEQQSSKRLVLSLYPVAMAKSGQINVMLSRGKVEDDSSYRLFGRNWPLNSNDMIISGTKQNVRQTSALCLIESRDVVVTSADDLPAKSKPEFKLAIARRVHRRHLADKSEKARASNSMPSRLVHLFVLGCCSLLLAVAPIKQVDSANSSSVIIETDLGQLFKGIRLRPRNHSPFAESTIVVASSASQSRPLIETKTTRANSDYDNDVIAFLGK